MEEDGNTALLNGVAGDLRAVGLRAELGHLTLAARIRVRASRMKGAT